MNHFRQRIFKGKPGEQGQSELRGKTHDIFISYNTNDEQIVIALHDIFHRYGLDAWTFKEIADWSRQRDYREILDTVQEHLIRSQLLLVICSGTSLTSTCVFDEIQISLDNSIPIFAWYPEGVRIRPFRGSEHYVNSNRHFLTVTSCLIDDRVKSFYGYGICGQNLEDFSRSIIYQLLLLDFGNPLKKQFNIKEMCYSVRHPTKLIPLFLGPDGKPLLHWRRPAHD